MPTTTGSARARVTADEVRAHVVSRYLEPARRAGERTFTVRVGDLMRELPGLSGVAVPCAALRSEKLFHRPNGLRLVEDRAPPSGLGNNVYLTFSIGAREAVRSAADTRSDSRPALQALLAMRGVGKAFYAEHGGGDAVLAEVREGWE